MPLIHFLVQSMFPFYTFLRIVNSVLLATCAHYQGRGMPVRAKCVAALSLRIYSAVFEGTLFLPTMQLLGFSPGSSGLISLYSPIFLPALLHV